MQNESSPNFSNFFPNFAPKFAPDFPEFLEECSCFVSWETGTRRKSPRIPDVFSMQNSQASSKKKSTIFFWRAGQVAKCHYNLDGPIRANRFAHAIRANHSRIPNPLLCESGFGLRTFRHLTAFKGAPNPNLSKFVPTIVFRASIWGNQNFSKICSIFEKSVRKLSFFQFLDEFLINFSPPG